MHKISKGHRSQDQFNLHVLVYYRRADVLLYSANINWDERMTALSEFNSVEMRVLGVVKDVLGLDELPQNLECSISEELALDSLDQLSLFMALEDEFGGRIKEEDAEKITTLRDIVEYIQNWNNTVPNA